MIVREKLSDRRDDRTRIEVLDVAPGSSMKPAVRSRTFIVGLSGEAVLAAYASTPTIIK